MAKHSDPRSFDYRSVMSGQYPPANTPNPDAVAARLERPAPAPRPGGVTTPPPENRPASRPSSNRMQTKTWIDGLGRQTRICDMNPHHLRGLLKVMKRAAVVHKSIRIVSLLDGTEVEGIKVDDNTNLRDLAESSWREHVPQPDMFESMEADWQRRYGNQPWDDAPEEEKLSLGTFVHEMIGRLAKPETVTMVTQRAKRSVNI